MPYITTLRRESLNPAINALAKELERGTWGDMNYAITRLLRRRLEPGYEGAQAVMGCLESVKHEFYRRVVVPYEEIKKAQNGDVF